MLDDKSLEAIAKATDDDLYGLLHIQPDCTEAEVRRAYKQRSLLEHPDKNPDDENAADKFIQIGIARDILVSPTLRQLYDAQRSRKNERIIANQQMDSRRKEMMEALQAQERQAESARNPHRRKRSVDMTAEELEERNLQRIRVENRTAIQTLMEKVDPQRREQLARYLDRTRPHDPAVFV